ncbi:MAG: hypothetical protein M0Z95_13820 [Actinomycetota bacterium]|nr:hypothetical protein [Actinomycetota bacterium]
MVQTWTVIGIFAAFAVGVLALMWTRMDRLDTKIDALGASLGAKIDNLDTKFTGEFAQVRSDITHLAESVGHVQGTLDEHLRRHDAHAVGT